MILRNISQKRNFQTVESTFYNTNTNTKATSESVAETISKRGAYKSTSLLAAFQTTGLVGDPLDGVRGAIEQEVVATLPGIVVAEKPVAIH
jgi:hypothetical protein